MFTPSRQAPLSPSNSAVLPRPSVAATHCCVGSCHTLSCRKQQISLLWCEAQTRPRGSSAAVGFTSLQPRCRPAGRPPHLEAQLGRDSSQLSPGLAGSTSPLSGSGRGMWLAQGPSGPRWVNSQAWLPASSGVRGTWSFRHTHCDGVPVYGSWAGHGSHPHTLRGRALWITRYRLGGHPRVCLPHPLRGGFGAAPGGPTGKSFGGRPTGAPSSAPTSARVRCPLGLQLGSPGNRACSQRPSWGGMGGVRGGSPLLGGGSSQP